MRRSFASHLGARQSVFPAEPLLARTAPAKQHRAGRDAQPRRNRSSKELALVIPASLSLIRVRWHPGHHIERFGRNRHGLTRSDDGAQVGAKPAQQIAPPSILRRQDEAG